MDSLLLTAARPPMLHVENISNSQVYMMFCFSVGPRSAELMFWHNSFS